MTRFQIDGGTPAFFSTFSKKEVVRVVDALSARDRRDVIRRGFYDRWELNLDKMGGEVEGEVFIKKSIAPPKGSKLRVTIEVVD